MANDKASKHLARLFIENFKMYESGASAQVRAAAPCF
jgi:ATP-dependent phosphoenolpyruvate carboxykinase